MRGDFYKQLTSNLETARAEGLFKEERIITSAQQADITVGDSHVINFCANNYLGLANHPELIAAAKSGMDSHGFGMASVRFICGTGIRISSWRRSWPISSVWKTRSSTPPASTPTAACLKRCSARKTPLSPTP